MFHGYDGYSEYDPYSHDPEPDCCEYEDSDAQYHDNPDHKDAPEGYEYEHEELGYEVYEAQELNELIQDNNGTGEYREVEECEHRELEYEGIEACEYEELTCEPDYHPETDHVAYEPHRFNYDDEQMGEYIHTHPSPFSTPTHLPGVCDIPLSIQHGHVTALKHVQDTHRFAHTDYNVREHMCTGYDTAEPTPTHSLLSTSTPIPRAHDLPRSNQGGHMTVLQNRVSTFDNECELTNADNSTVKH
jgi:hypothetical protein